MSLHVFEQDYKHMRVAVELNAVIAVWDNNDGTCLLWLKYSGPTETVNVTASFDDVMAMMRSA